MSRIRMSAAALHAGELLGGIAIVVMMVHVSLDVAARKLLGAPLPGTLAIVAYYYMVIAAFAPLAAVERVRGHIAVDAALDLAPRRLRHHVQNWTGLVAGIAIALVAWRGWTDAVRDWNIGAVQVQGSDIVPVWPARFVVPLGASLLAITLLGRFTTYLTGNAYPLRNQ